MAKQLGLQWKGLRKLGDLQVQLKKTLKEMLDLVDELIHSNPYSKKEILELLEADEEQLMTTSLSSNTSHCKSTFNSSLLLILSLPNSLLLSGSSSWLLQDQLLVQVELYELLALWYLELLISCHLFGIYF